MKNTHEFQDEEIWKPIQGFEGLYAVSSKGRVMNLKSGKVMKNNINPNGYAFVALYKGDNTKPKAVTVHKLVATAFIENTDNLPEVNHIDENKINNDVTNLEWVSASQNQRHSAHTKSCRINQLTLDGEFIRTWESSEQIKRELGFNQGNIIQCCKRNKNYSHVGGFKWQYADPSQQRKYNRPVAALTMDGEFVAEYKSAAEAARSLKIRVNSIHYCLNGTYKSTNGLRFIYIDN